MNAENFLQWQQRQGNKVFHTESSYWYEASPHVFQAFPYHWIISPTEVEIKKLLIKNGIIALRYSTPIDSKIGKISYHIVQFPPYELNQIRKKSRKSVVDGLQHCKVEPITMDYLATEGWNLQQDTLTRQCRENCMRQKEWESLCYSAKGLPGFQGWGAFVDNHLAACLLTTIIDNTGYILYSLSDHQFLGFCVNNAIFYTVTNELLKDNQVKKVFLTVQSLDAPASVDMFKFRMGYQPVYVRQRVVFHPLIQPFINHFSHTFIKKVLNVYSDNRILPKAEGMIRFYLEGKLDKEKQQLPECMEKNEDICFNKTVSVQSH